MGNVQYQRSKAEFLREAGYRRDALAIREEREQAGQQRWKTMVRQVQGGAGPVEALDVEGRQETPEQPPPAAPATKAAAAKAPPTKEKPKAKAKKYAWKSRLLVLKCSLGMRCQRECRCKPLGKEHCRGGESRVSSAAPVHGTPSTSHASCEWSAKWVVLCIRDAFYESRSLEMERKAGGNFHPRLLISVKITTSFAFHFQGT